MWESGWVASNRSSLIEFGSVGAPPVSTIQSHWSYKVQVHVNSDACQSDVATFRTTVLATDEASVEREWNHELGSEWIGASNALPSSDCDCYDLRKHPLLRREINIATELGIRSMEEVAFASAYWVGLGYGRVWANGERASDAELDPAWTTYANRTLYSVADATPWLQSTGTDAPVISDSESKGLRETLVIAVELGKGYFDPLPMRLFGKFDLRATLSTVGPPTLRLVLLVRLRNGQLRTVATEAGSGKWTAGGGGLLRDNVYLGEIRDYRIDSSS